METETKLKPKLEIYLGESESICCIWLCKETSLFTFRPMRCDTTGIWFGCGFLIVSNFSSNQMNEYLIRSGINISMDRILCLGLYTKCAKYSVYKGEKVIQWKNKRIFDLGRKVWPLNINSSETAQKRDVLCLHLAPLP